MLTEAIQDKNMSLAKLSELTGISERFLAALVEQKFEKLPSAPYVRGYLFKIAETLNLDGEKLWQEYQKNTQLKKSGVNDHLPLNRYALQPLNKKLILLGVILFFIVGYLVLRYNLFLGKPSLSLTGEILNSTNPVVYNSLLKIEGWVKSGDQLMINKENIYVSENGYFQKDFSLHPGLNIVQFQIKRFLGRETIITKQVLYFPKNEQRQ